MSKQALAVKYRPKRFSDVVEQDVTKAILTEQLENKTFKNCLLFCGGAGTGKAQPLNSKVLTPKGFIKMKKVKVGTEVITGNYKVADVTEVHPQGKRKIYKIWLSNGDTIKVSDEHINVIYKENNKGSFDESTIITKDLIEMDYTNLFMRKIVGEGLFNAYYSIANIKYIGMQKCQCIYVDAPEHTYITDNYIVTHNTTSARIFANEINEFKGEPIEIDAASNNSVEDARRIIESAKTQSLDSEYKVFVLDECHMLSNAAWNAMLKLVEEPPKKSIFLFCVDENGLVCTKDGVKRIKDVQRGDYVWTGNDFHVVNNVFNNGQRECLRITLTNGESIKCTPDHKIKVLDGTVEVWKKASELTCGDSIAVYHSYAVTTDIDNITDTECWFLGYLTGNGHYSHHSLEFYTPTNKLEFVHQQLDRGVSEGWLDHYEDVRFNGSITTQIHFPRNCMNLWYNKTGCDCHYKKGTKSIPSCVYRMSTRQLSLFVQGWFDADGTGFGKKFLTDVSHPHLTCASEQMVYDLQQLLIIHGFDVRLYCSERTNVKLPEGRIYEKTYNSYILALSHKSGFFRNTKLENWLYEHRTKSCTPYVPEARQLLNSNNNRVSPTMIEKSKLPDLQGNKWYQNIKSIEYCGVCNVYDIEVPDVHEFIYNNIKVHNCTTDPHKIPDTILSRVQRYNFQKISQEGIVNRLKYIIEQENKEDSTNPITYEESALEHIAKVADGGMRDSITLLDKSIGYNNNLTLNNVLEALGSVNYDTMFDLTDALNVMNKKKVIEIVESIHKSGLDLKQFIKQYTLFVLDVCKYDLFRDFTYLQLPNIYKDRLDKYDANAYAFFNQLLNEVSTLSNNLRYESMPKPVVEATFLQLCTEA